MSVRNLLLIALTLSTASLGCSGSPTQAEGTVSVTQTTSTTTSTSTTTTVIPQLNAGAVATSPTGLGLAWATVWNFLLTTPPSGGVPPYTYAWDFGDGAMGAGSAPSHTYQNTGTFTATVTTTDTRGISAQASTRVTVASVSGRWVASFTGVPLKPQPLDILQNQTAVIVTINDSANGLGFASGAGNVSNPRMMSVSATFTAGAPFAVTYLGTINETLTEWMGNVIGLPGCPCQFTATRQ